MFEEFRLHGETIHRKLTLWEQILKEIRANFQQIDEIKANLKTCGQQLTRLEQVIKKMLKGQKSWLIEKDWSVQSKEVPTKPVRLCEVTNKGDLELVELANISTTTAVYFGMDSNLKVENGFPLFPQTESDPFGITRDLYAICETGNAIVKIKRFVLDLDKRERRN